jgi:hypothetical protein
MDGKGPLALSFTVISFETGGKKGNIRRLAGLTEWIFAGNRAVITGKRLRCCSLDYLNYPSNAGRSDKLVKIQV